MGSPCCTSKLTLRIKSYLLEVIVLGGVESGRLVLEEKSTPQRYRDFFAYVESKWGSLMDQGSGVPRILDPQLGHSLTSEWSRPEFETLMRRVREALAIADRALGTEDEDEAIEEWASLFGHFWPSENEIKEAARGGAEGSWPGSAAVLKGGTIVGVGTPGSLATRATKFYGEIR